MYKGTLTKWPVQKLAQGTTQTLLQYATDSPMLAMLLIVYTPLLLLYMYIYVPGMDTTYN